MKLLLTIIIFLLVVTTANGQSLEQVQERYESRLSSAIEKQVEESEAAKTEYLFYLDRQLKIAEHLEKTDEARAIQKLIDEIDKPVNVGEAELNFDIPQNKYRTAYTYLLRPDSRGNLKINAKHPSRKDEKNYTGRWKVVPVWMVTFALIDWDNTYRTYTSIVYKDNGKTIINILDRSGYVDPNSAKNLDKILDAD